MALPRARSVRGVMPFLCVLLIILAPWLSLAHAGVLSPQGQREGMVREGMEMAHMSASAAAAPKAEHDCAGRAEAGTEVTSATASRRVADATRGIPCPEACRMACCPAAILPVAFVLAGGGRQALELRRAVRLETLETSVPLPPPRRRV